MSDIPELGVNPEQDILEDAGAAFNPGAQHLDLSKEEKRRTTALLMAIQAYDKLIIKHADYLAEAARLAARDEGPKLQPATIDAMVDAAFKFDAFIAGVDVPKGDVIGRGALGEGPTEEELEAQREPPPFHHPEPTRKGKKRK